MATRESNTKSIPRAAARDVIETGPNWRRPERTKASHILRYLHDESLRQRVQLQLNRGESPHQLARRLFSAIQGAFRTGDYEEIVNINRRAAIRIKPASSYSP